MDSSDDDIQILYISKKGNKDDGRKENKMKMDIPKKEDVGSKGKKRKKDVHNKEEDAKNGETSDEKQGDQEKVRRFQILQDAVVSVVNSTKIVLEALENVREYDDSESTRINHIAKKLGNVFKRFEQGNKDEEHDTTPSSLGSQEDIFFRQVFKLIDEQQQKQNKQTITPSFDFCMKPQRVKVVFEEQINEVKPEADVERKPQSETNHTMAITVHSNSRRLEEGLSSYSDSKELTKEEKAEMNRIVNEDADNSVEEGNYKPNSMHKNSRLPISFKSPYIISRMPILRERLSNKELLFADYTFLEQDPKRGITSWEPLFSSGVNTLRREDLECMKSPNWLLGYIIDSWAFHLNYIRNTPTSENPATMFCSTRFGPLVAKRFDYVMTQELGLINKTKATFDSKMVFFPIHIINHFVVMCINSIRQEVVMLNNRSASVSQYRGVHRRILKQFGIWVQTTYGASTFKNVDNYKWKFPNVEWQDDENKIDCGIYVMRHMEMFRGQDLYNYDNLLIAAKEDPNILVTLRIKYVYNLLLSPSNIHRENLKRKVLEYYTK